MVDLMKLVKETCLAFSSCSTFLEDQLAMRLAIDSKELSNGAVEKLAQFFKSKCKVVIEQVLPMN